MKHFGNISAVAMATKQNLHNHSCNIWYSKNIYSYRRKKSDLIEKGLRPSDFVFISFPPCLKEIRPH